MHYTGYFMLLLATAVLTKCDSTIPEIKECSLNHPNNTRFIWRSKADTCDYIPIEVSLDTVDWDVCEKQWKNPRVTAIVEDNPVPDDTENRAERTLPTGLILKESGIPGAGRGIWTEKFLKKGIRFGPYDGETYAFNKEDSEDSGYAWLVFCNHRTILYTDGGNERRSNWLRWINTPMRHVDENIKSYQYRGQRYYITSKPIQPGTELLVFYGEDYAKHLGIDMLKYFSYDGVDWKECDENSQTDLPTHPLTIVKDTPVPDECDDRARRSLPYGLVVKESGIPGAGLGVWAEWFFPEGVRFGHYEGQTFEYEKEAADSSGYSWVIFCGKRNIYYIDGENERKSNWIRYINAARNADEENLKTYQQDGRIYYWTSKPIHPGTELLEFYGEDFARLLGIDMDNYHNSS